MEDKTIHRGETTGRKAPGIILNFNRRRKKLTTSNMDRDLTIFATFLPAFVTSAMNSTSAERWQHKNALEPRGRGTATTRRISDGVSHQLRQEIGLLRVWYAGNASLTKLISTAKPATHTSPKWKCAEWEEILKWKEGNR